MRTHNPFRLVEFTLPNDTDTPKTTFQLGYFTSEVRAYIYDKHLGKYAPQEDEKESPKLKLTLRQIMEWYRDCVRFGLKGVKDFTNEDGEEVKLRLSKFNDAELSDVDCVPDDFIRLLDDGAISTIGTEIWTLNFPNKEAAKN